MRQAHSSSTNVSQLWYVMLQTWTRKQHMKKLRLLVCEIHNVMLFCYAVTLHQCLPMGGDKIIAIILRGGCWGVLGRCLQVYTRNCCENVILTAFWSVIFPKLMREWGAGGVRWRYTGKCNEQNTVRNREGADRLENTWKREAPIREMQCIGTSHSYLWFPCSLLELEVIPVPHLAGCPNALICAPRSEEHERTLHRGLLLDMPP